MKIKLDNRARDFLQRIRILGYYSNPRGKPICNNCGEQDIEVLCLDHIEGGGRRQLRETKSKGSSFYRWLGVNGYPNGYQVLCANCNMKKAKLEQVETRTS